jgi:hypothetical protein
MEKYRILRSLCKYSFQNNFRKYSNRKRGLLHFSTNNESSPKVKSMSHDDTPQKLSQSTIGSYIGATYQTVESFEESLMRRIHQSNKERFRFLFLATVVFGLWFFNAFGEDIATKIGILTKGFLHETLEDKSIKNQAQELAIAVVQTVLNDKEVAKQAANFLREASQSKETQDALLQLTLHILQHPDSQTELTALAKRTVNVMVTDEVCNFLRYF